jgi:hypothetical protein
MKTSLATICAAAATSAFLSFACSSTTSPTPVDAGSSGDGGVADAAPVGACVKDRERVAKDDSGVCCTGLFKACVGVAEGDQSPCICSTVECGTATMQPPANVPCCPGVGSSSCGKPIGTGGASDTQCTCS